jgi:predicted RNase H-like HicB family nuclease
MEKQVLGFNFIIQQDEDGTYTAQLQEIKGCHTQGKTMDEVTERIKEAIYVCLEGDKDEVTPITN